MRSYPDWLNFLRMYLLRYPGSLQQACQDLSSRVSREGVLVSEWTLRKHADRNFQDVGLNLACAITRVIEEEEEEEDQ